MRISSTLFQLNSTHIEPGNRRPNFIAGRPLDLPKTPSPNRGGVRQAKGAKPFGSEVPLCQALHEPYVQAFAFAGLLTSVLHSKADRSRHRIDSEDGKHRPADRGRDPLLRVPLSGFAQRQDALMITASTDTPRKADDGASTAVEQEADIAEYSLGIDPVTDPMSANSAQQSSSAGSCCSCLRPLVVSNAATCAVGDARDVVR